MRQGSTEWSGPWRLERDRVLGTVAFLIFAQSFLLQIHLLFKLMTLCGTLIWEESLPGKRYRVKGDPYFTAKPYDDLLWLVKFEGDIFVLHSRWLQRCAIQKAVVRRFASAASSLYFSATASARFKEKARRKPAFPKTRRQNCASWKASRNFHAAGFWKRDENNNLSALQNLWRHAGSCCGFLLW